jgi:hypothetical protein
LDQDFLLFEHNELDLDSSPSLARETWIDSQSAIVVFNLASEELTFVSCKRMILSIDDIAMQKFLSNTQSLLEGGRSTCTADETDLFEGTRFDVRLDIANNLMHTSAYTTVAEQGRHQKGVTHQLQYVARAVERVTKASYRCIPFSTLSGNMMNIASRKDGVSGLLPLRRRLLDFAHFRL